MTVYTIENHTYGEEKVIHADSQYEAVEEYLYGSDGLEQDCDILRDLSEFSEIVPKIRFSVEGGGSANTYNCYLDFTPKLKYYVVD